MGRRNASSSTKLDDPYLGDLEAPIEVRRHPAARRLTLRVSRTRRAVIVTLPTQCDLGEAQSFVHKHIDWVRERLGNVPAPVPFENDILMPLRDVVHRVVFDGKKTKNVSDCDGPVSVIESAAGCREIHVAGACEHAPRRLRDWLFEEARADLDRSVIYHARRLKLRPKRLSVRDQVSRWGSCSTTGALSFSWRLVMAPPFVLDYVAAHEVAHLAEMNHGPKFWALVQKTAPRTDEAKNWLQVYGMNLHRYGAE